MTRNGMILWAVLGATGMPAVAQDVEDWEKTRDRIAEMRAQARQVRQEAFAKRNEAEKKCQAKFLASSCLEDARKSQIEEERQAKGIENEASALERKLKAHQHALKEAQRNDKTQRQDAEANKRAAKIRQEEEKTQKRLEKKAAKARSQCACPCD